MCYDTWNLFIKLLKEKNRLHEKFYQTCMSTHENDIGLYLSMAIFQNKSIILSLHLKTFVQISNLTLIFYIKCQFNIKMYIWILKRQLIIYPFLTKGC